jgi:hypothetical protein
MWRKYFKVIHIVPGRVVVPGRGTIDFSRDDLSIDLLKDLWEKDFPYIELTDEGRDMIYDIPSKKEELILAKDLPEYVTPDIGLPTAPVKKKSKRNKSKNSALGQL